jgi:hypothetical protein
MTSLFRTFRRLQEEAGVVGWLLVIIILAVIVVIWLIVQILQAIF